MSTDPKLSGRKYLCRYCGQPCRNNLPCSNPRGHRIENVATAIQRKQVHEAKEALAKEFDPDHPSKRWNPDAFHLADAMRYTGSHTGRFSAGKNITATEIKARQDAAANTHVIEQQWIKEIVDEMQRKVDAEVFGPLVGRPYGSKP